MKMTYDNDKLTNLSGLRRIDLVGREDVINAISNAGKWSQEKGRQYLFFMTGKGGVGKTAILDKTRQGLFDPRY